jgi:hypothetical protein
MCAFVFIGRPSHATFARPQHARRNRLKSYLSLLARCPFNWGYKHKLRISSAPVQDPPPQYFDGRRMQTVNILMMLVTRRESLRSLGSTEYLLKWSVGQALMAISPIPFGGQADLFSASGLTA